MRTPDILYIGFPKTASTFIRGFLEFHPEVHVDQRAQAFITAPDQISIADVEASAMADARCYVSMAEKIAEGVVFEGDFPWRDIMFDSAAADRLQGQLEVSPDHWARALAGRFPEARILMAIRDQVDWLGSAYRYYVSQLASDRRSFLDFCETPKGAVLLRAGHYDLTIGAYREAFGAERVAVLRYEALRQDRSEFLASLCSFLGVEPVDYQGAPANVGRSALVTSVHASAPWLGNLPGPLRDAVKSVANWLSRHAGDGSLTETERRFIKSTFAASNLRTEALLADH